MAAVLCSWEKLFEQIWQKPSQGTILSTLVDFWLIVLEFNDKSTLVGHFVSYTWERENREIVEEMKDRDNEEKEQEWKWRKKK